MNKAQSISIAAPAKINLFLEVLGKRSDGYHAIDTIFQNIDLSDEVTLTKIKSGVRIRVSGKYKKGVPKNNTNSAVKAAIQIKNKLNETRGVLISLKKNIPSGAGLGGGSSDAAAVVKYLPGLFNKKLSKKEEYAIASKLGADVPFCLKGGCARGQGIGCTLTPVKNKSTFWGVMVYPNMHCSTALIYNRLKRKKILTNHENIHNIIQSLQAGKTIHYWGKFLFNRLENVTLEFFSRLKMLRALFFKAGAEYVLMSGSGSVFFALMDSRKKAVAVKKYIKNTFALKNKTIWLVRPCGGIKKIR